jgi:DNA-binding transcriptional LysR family regulator
MKRINFNFDELQSFVVVAEKLSFRAAADALHISQPALSRRIDKLEWMLETQLLERTTRRVTLTPAGHQFVLHAGAAMDALRSAMTQMSDQASRRSLRLTVACVPSVANRLLPMAMQTLVERHPEARLHIIDESAQEVLRSILAGEADFGLNFLGAQVPEIDFQPIYTESYVLVAPRGHVLAKRKAVVWKDLLDEKMISVAASSGNRTLIDNAVAALPQRPVVFYEANHVAGALGLVAAGLGVAALPSLALSSATHPDLVGVPLGDPAVTRTLGLISLKGKKLGAVAADLYALLAAQR